MYSSTMGRRHEYYVQTISDSSARLASCCVGVCAGPRGLQGRPWLPALRLCSVRRPCIVTSSSSSSSTLARSTGGGQRWMQEHGSGSGSGRGSGRALMTLCGRVISVTSARSPAACFVGSAAGRRAVKIFDSSPTGPGGDAARTQASKQQRVGGDWAANGFFLPREEPRSRHSTGACGGRPRRAKVM